MGSIRFNQVSKRFTLRHERSRSFQQLFLDLLRFQRPTSKEKYWALRDVSFQVGAGEMVGIVGDNGAGKSTLLKLITRIIEPTSGEIHVDGRVSALLELGAGFHPDLTGRENVYLNGSILGFSRREVDRIFDEVLEFSEMERFIDVPVKHYSSGMYMRLGFSIAIHVRPDILLVDEILAVGDQAFQLRCLDKINEMKRRGITIILVTHDLGTVRELCTQAIWLDDGEIQAEGATKFVLEQYLAQVHAEDQEVLQRAEAGKHESADGDESEVEEEAAWRWGSHEAEIVRVQLLDGEGRERRTFRTGEPFVARMHYRAHRPIERPLFGIALHHADGFHICGPNTDSGGYDVGAIDGEGAIDFVVPSLPLLQGTYLFSAALYNPEGTQAYDHHHMAYTFRVVTGKEIGEQFGSIYFPSHWRLADDRD